MKTEYGFGTKLNQLSITTVGLGKVTVKLKWLPVPVLHLKVVLKLRSNTLNKVWFTSDLHFFHKNIVKFTNRGKETSLEDHAEWLV